MTLGAKVERESGQGKERGGAAGALDAGARTPLWTLDRRLAAAAARLRIDA